MAGASSHGCERTPPRIFQLPQNPSQRRKRFDHAQARASRASPPPGCTPEPRPTTAPAAQASHSEAGEPTTSRNGAHPEARACSMNSDCFKRATAARTMRAGAAHPSVPSNRNVTRDRGCGRDVERQAGANRQQQKQPRKRKEQVGRAEDHGFEPARPRVPPLPRAAQRRRRTSPRPPAPAAARRAYRTAAV